MVIFFNCHIIYTQNLSPNIIASAGGSVLGTGMEIQWSLGQTGTQTIIGPNIILTEGFQQPFSSLTVVNDHAEIKSLSIFPNPTIGVLTVSVSDKNVKTLSCYIVNSIGEVVLICPTIEGTQTFNIDVSRLDCGAYFLLVKDEKFKFSKSYSFFKISRP